MYGRSSTSLPLPQLTHTTEAPKLPGNARLMAPGARTPLAAPQAGRREIQRGVLVLCSAVLCRAMMCCVVLCFAVVWCGVVLRCGREREDRSVVTERRSENQRESQCVSE